MSKPTTGAPQAAKMAYGVDPWREERYSLRQARYDWLAKVIDVWAGEAEAEGRKLSLVDVGCGQGVLYRYLEPRPHQPNIEITGADFEPMDRYKPERYAAYIIDELTEGNPNTPSNAYDVVVCEQVLEHLPRVDKAIAALERMAKPGGRVCVGVPIFLPPLHILRNLWIAHSLRTNPEKTWSHIQTFSMRSFLDAMRRHSSLRLVEVRGFRIVSGGALRKLENYQWWWRLHQRIGAAIPWACIEVQGVFVKPE